MITLKKFNIISHPKMHHTGNNLEIHTERNGINSVSQALSILVLGYNAYMQCIHYKDIYKLYLFPYM